MSTLTDRIRGRRGPGDEAAFDRKLIAPMVLGALLNPVNSSMLAVALVPIGMAFGAPPSETVWLVTGLYLATAVGQPVVGRLVDQYGPRTPYLLGAALVGLAGILGAVAPNLGTLVLARVLIGIGTCAGYPAAMYLIRREADRTGIPSPSGILAALAVSTQVTAVIGPTLGGFLIGLGGWRTIFLVNVPLALASLLLGWRRLPRVPTVQPAPGEPTGLDAPGIVAFAVTLVTLMLFLTSPDLDRWYLLVIVVVAGVAFVWRELHTAAPFLDLRVLAGNLPLLATYARQLLALTVSYGFLYGYTQWLEAGRGLSASQAGLILLPMFLVGVIVTTVSGRRPEVWLKLVVGGSVLVAACAAVLFLEATSPIWVLVVLSLVLGIPQGLLSLANQNALYHQADPERIGASAGLLRTFTYLGALIASAANGAFFGTTVDTTGLHELAGFLVGCAVLLLIVTLVDRSLRRVGRAVAVEGSS
ncbi:MAG TPA: MFS transporter [Lapillicoccus sp.]|uniref:MFS transporter n=1 Tax=Lapillicoccus sp. TaxID=1909287 RepID=UPI002F92700A